MQPKEFGPLNHFDYNVLDKFCTCSLCVEHRETLDVYLKHLNSIKDHDDSCRCDPCKQKYKLRSATIAVTNRRDLYCESSFHANIEPDLGLGYMRWIGEQVKAGFQSIGWWEHTAHDRSMGFWFNKFHAVSGTVLAVSGAAA